MPASPAETLSAFCAAIGAGDLDAARALCDPAAAIWHSTDRTTQSVDEMITNARGVLASVKGFHYGDLVVTATENGAVAQASLRGQAGPNALDVPVCIVTTIQAGKITAAWEYIDQGHLPR